MIKFIYGDFSSSKTEAILNMIREDTLGGVHTFLIVPDQEALLAERLTLSMLPSSSQLELEVLGFSRLYNRVCREYGNICYAYLSKPMKYLIMWKALRELRGVLETIGADAKRDLANEELLLSAINELKINGVSADELDKSTIKIEKSSPELAAKIRDISAIYSTFELFTNEKYSDSADDLSRLYSILEEHNFFRNCNVYIDSFTSFTPVQHKIISQIFKSAKNVTVTFPCKKNELTDIDKKSIFLSHEKLLTSAKAQKLDVTEFYCADNPEKSENLKYLSKYIWQFDPKSIPSPPNPDESIVLEICDTPYSEAEAVSAHIRKLLSSGARCSDIVIITRNSDSYKGIIDQSLKRSEIPFYFSDSIDLCSTAAVKFILSALRIKLYNWQKNDVISLIKTGLCDISATDANLFEEYVNTWDIKGKQFQDDVWNMNPDGFSKKLSERGSQILSSANTVRSTVVPALEKLFIALDADDTVDGMCRSLYTFMLSSSLKEKLAELASKASLRNDFKSAQEFLRIYNVILSSLADIGTALEGERATTEEFISILKSVFEKTELNTIPTSIDEVTIGSANTLRTSSPKYAFVMGLCEGKFPASVKDSGIFSFADKELLASNGIQLDSSAELRSSEELMYLTRSFSIPEEKLFLLSHRSEISGDTCFKSLAFSRVEALLNLEAHNFSEDDFSYLIPAPKNAALALRSLKDANAKASLITALSPYVEGIEQGALEAIKTKDASTTLPLNDESFIKFSATSFESYAKCPFNYFCRYTLGLREKKTSGFGADNVGLFIHEVLENVIRHIVPEKSSDSTVSDDELIALTEKSVTQYINSVCPTHLLLSKRLNHLYARLKRLALLLARNIIKEFKDSDFYPAYFEMKLNGSQGNPAPLTFTLNNGTKVSISGIVDRVDIYKSEGKVYVRIVDYKTGSKKFDLADLKYGVNTQMLLYLYTICRNASYRFKEEIGAIEDTLEPSGIIYLSSSLSDLNCADYQAPEDIEEEVEKKLLRSGILLDDEDVLCAMNHSLNSSFLPGISRTSTGKLSGKTLTSRQKFDDIYNELETVIIKISTELNNGKISAHPLKSKNSPCEYCTSKPICRNVQK